MIRCPTLPFVPSAIALGHLGAYALAHPDPTQRAHALVGHGHLWAIVAIGAVSGLVGLAALAHARSLDRRLAPRRGRLAALGALGFWVVEVGERTVHGGVDTLASEPALWWGLVLQAAVAAVLFALARSAAHVGVRFAPRRRGHVVPPSSEPPWRPGPRRVASEAARTPPNRRRGPPCLAA